MKQLIDKTFKYSSWLLSIFADPVWGLGRVIALAYHSISGGGSPNSIPLSVFEEQMKYLKGSSYNVMSLDGLLSFRKEKFINGRNVLITFDDGYEDLYLNALPVLKKYNLPAVCFINPALLGSSALHATREIDKGRKILNEAQVIELSKNRVAISNHGQNHFYFDEGDADKIKREYLNAKKWIDENVKENNFGHVFAYPKSRISKESEELLKSLGNELSFAGEGSITRFNLEKEILPRVTVFPDWTLKDFKMHLSPTYSYTKSKRDMIEKMIRYGLAAVLNLASNLAITALLVEVFRWEPVFAYPTALTIDYIVKYITNMKFVFKKSGSFKYAPAFIAYLITFWFFNNAVFYIFERLLGVPYALAIILNMAIFWGLRFWVLHKFVFKD